MVGFKSPAYPDFLKAVDLARTTSVVYENCGNESLTDFRDVVSTTELELVCTHIGTKRIYFSSVRNILAF